MNNLHKIHDGHTGRQIFDGYHTRTVSQWARCPVCKKTFYKFEAKIMPKPFTIKHYSENDHEFYEYNTTI